MATGSERIRDGRAVAPSGGPSNAVLLALLWLSGTSAFLLLYWGSKLTFLFDDWDLLVYRRGLDAHSVLQPHGEQVVVLPALAYDALRSLFGMGSALPYRVLTTAMFVTGALLLFAYLRRRVGDWPALAATAVVLFLGAAWEDLLWPFQMGYLGAMACGLGALLAIESPARRRDPLACLLLCAAVFFSTLGFAFAIGVALAILLGEERRGRIYVFAVPLILYALWWAGWGHASDTHLTVTHAGLTPMYVLNGFAAAIASLLGLAAPQTGGSPGGLDWGRPLAVLLGLLALWRIHRLGRVPRGVWPVLAVAVVFWALAGINQEPGQAATASRYQYLGAVFVLLIAAELLRGVRIPRAAVVVALLLAAGSVAANAHYLRDAYAGTYRPASQLEKAALGAVEIARDHVDPRFTPTAALVGEDLVEVEAGPYLAAADADGSPAYDEAELAEAPGPARFVADKVLFSALGVSLEPAAAPARRGCAAAPAREGATAWTALPPGGATLVAGRPISAVRLRRFARGRVPIELEEEVPAGGAAELTISRDRAAAAWQVQLVTDGTALVCGSGRPLQ